MGNTNPIGAGSIWQGRRCYLASMDISNFEGGLCNDVSIWLRAQFSPIRNPAERMYEECMKARDWGKIWNTALTAAAVGREMFRLYKSNSETQLLQPPTGSWSGSTTGLISPIITDSYLVFIQHTLFTQPSRWNGLNLPHLKHSSSCGCWDCLKHNFDL